MLNPSEIDHQATPQLDMRAVLKDATNFTGIKTAVVGAIQEMRVKGATRIGFISGPLGETSGYVNDQAGSAWKKSMNEMKKVEEEMITQYQIPIFSSADIFGTKWEELVEGRQINEGLLVGDEKSAVMNSLFHDLLIEGGITDIFMMKGWRNAPGAVYEHSVANRPDSVIAIHDLDL